MSYRALTHWAVALMLACPLGARATVDAFIPYFVPVQHLQTDDVCLERQTMWAELGIPPASQMEAIAAATLVYRQGGEHVDVNMLSQWGGLVPSYVSDHYVGDVLNYEMTLDVSALAARLGTSLSGRQQTVRAAKLYLLAMAKSLAEIAPAGYRLTARFTGLPSQAGLNGTRLYAQTSWPYSAGSSLLAAYEHELVNVEGGCR